jgi:hypothetical protein
MSSSATVARVAVLFVRVSRDALVALGIVADESVGFLAEFADGTFRLARAVAFWTAVLTPLLLLWLLFQRSPVLSDPVAVLKLVTVNVTALVVGHGYGEPPHREA